MDPTQKALLGVASWGNILNKNQIISSKDCWAIQQGVCNVVDDTHGLRCSHNLEPSSNHTLCVPMIVTGEALGLLYFEFTEKSNNNQDIQNLAISIAELFALSFSNLKLRETLHDQSMRDHLTKLFNRRYMEESLVKELHRAARNNTQVGIMMLDIDHFKRLNDTFGHEMGDLVMKKLGVILQQYIREEDIACRYGGEEFILILPGTNLETTRERAETIRSAVNNTVVEYEHYSTSFTVSIGIAISPEHGSNSETILRAVDAALYQAKNEGRNRIEIYQPLNS
jgi:diguanylate cyclase (GGDEF)-like protein